MRTVKLTESETLFIEARIADVLHHSESSNGVKRLAQNVLDSIAQSEPDTTERGPDRKPTIHVEPGALNHIRVFALVQFMVAQGLEMVQDGTQLLIRRKAGTGHKPDPTAGGAFRCVDPTAMDDSLGDDEEEVAPVEQS